MPCAYLPMCQIHLTLRWELFIFTGWAYPEGSTLSLSNSELSQSRGAAHLPVCQQHALHVSSAPHMWMDPKVHPMCKQASRANVPQCEYTPCTSMPYAWAAQCLLMLHPTWVCPLCEQCTLPMNTPAHSWLSPQSTAWQQCGANEGLSNGPIHPREACCNLLEHSLQ